MTGSKRLDLLAGGAVGLAAVGMLLALVGATLGVESLLVAAGLLVCCSAAVGVIFFGYTAYLVTRRD